MFGAYGGARAEEFYKSKKLPAGASDKLLQALGAAKDEMDAIAKDKKAYDDAKVAAKKEGEAVESIVTGQKEQMNWLALSKFLDEAIPRPESVALARETPDAKGVWAGPKPERKNFRDDSEYKQNPETWAKTEAFLN